MRRPGVGVGRRGGFRGSSGGGGGALAYDPSQDPSALLWWHAADVSGPVSAWVDRIAGVTAAQGTAAQQPTASATAIGGTHPGVSSDGGDILVAAGAGAVLGGKTQITITAVMVDASDAVATAIANSASVSAAGALLIIPNGAGTGRISAVANGAAGSTSRWCVESLASARVISVVMDYAAGGESAVAAIRVNGVAQALTNTSATSTAGSVANAAVALFGRPGGTALWPGTLGDIVFRDSIAQDAGLAAIEAYVAAQAGIAL